MSTFTTLLIRGEIRKHAILSVRMDQRAYLLTNEYSKSFNITSLAAVHLHNRFRVPEPVFHEEFGDGYD